MLDRALGNPHVHQQPYLKVSEVARMLRTSHYRVSKMVKDGTIPSVRLGNLVRVRREDLEAVMTPSRPALNSETPGC